MISLIQRDSRGEIRSGKVNEDKSRFLANDAWLGTENLIRKEKIMTGTV